MYVFMTLLRGETRGEKSARTEALIAPYAEVLQFLVISPAVGTNAAVNRRGFGMSRWQLADQSTPVCRVRGGEMAWGNGLAGLRQCRTVSDPTLRKP
jgi:hypothetical protein